jgi:hypothetical protein
MVLTVTAAIHGLFLAITGQPISKGNVPRDFIDHDIIGIFPVVTVTMYMSFVLIILHYKIRKARPPRYEVILLVGWMAVMAAASVALGIYAAAVAPKPAPLCSPSNST